MPDYADLGMGFAVAFLILREVFGFITNFVKKKNGDDSGNISAKIASELTAVRNILSEEYREMSKSISEIKHQQDDLWNWHNVQDKDGVKVWYVRQGLSQAVKDVGSAITSQNVIMERQAVVLETLSRTMERMNDKIDELGKGRGR